MNRPEPRLSERTQAIADGRQFVAGVFVGDESGAEFTLEGYRRGIEQIQSFGGTPIFFQSYGLIEQSEEEIVDAYQTLARDCSAVPVF